MCGRITLTNPDIDEIAELLGARPDPELKESYRPRYNLPPTDPHVIVKHDAGERRLVSLRWGLAPPGQKPQINARAESVAKIGIFKRSFQERRCLVVADGFYEWMGDKAHRRPIWFHARPGELLLMAGIYDALGFAVITTPANDDVAPVHDRMPALLPADRADRWLRTPDLALLVPAEKGVLIVTPVSTRVNSVANDDPACLGPPDDEPRQLRLV